MSAQSRRREPSAAEAALLEGLAPGLSALGVDLEDLRISKAGRRELVRVVIDKDSGIDLDAVAEASRFVSDALDQPELAVHLPGPFVLEVTSPGVDRPLTEPRHWKRSVGRLVDIDLVDGTNIVGRVVSVHDDSADVDVSGDARPVAYADVAKAVVQVEFTQAPSGDVEEPGVSDFAPETDSMHESDQMHESDEE